MKRATLLRYLTVQCLLAIPISCEARDNVLESTPRLIVQWRIGRSGYNYAFAAGSKDGRRFVFYRTEPEPFDFMLRGNVMVRGNLIVGGNVQVQSSPQLTQYASTVNRRRKLWDRALKQNRWLGSPALFLVEPGRMAPKQIGYGLQARFLENDRTVEVAWLLQPLREGSMPESQRKSIALKTGRISAGPTLPVRSTEMYMHTAVPPTRRYFGVYSGSPGRLTEVLALPLSGPKAQSLLRVTGSDTVDGVFETVRGPVLVYDRTIRDRSGGFSSVYDLRRPHGEVLYRFRPDADSDALATQMPDGSLLICDAVMNSKPGLDEYSTRWLTLDPVSGKSRKLVWAKEPLDVLRRRYLSVTRDGRLVAVARVFDPPAGHEDGPYSTRISVYRFGDSKCVAEWTTGGTVDQLSWTRDGRCLMVSISGGFAEFDARPTDQIVVLRLPDRVMRSLAPGGPAKVRPAVPRRSLPQR